ncbi:MAG: hypothetical protein H0U47_00225 [Nocardioidaceae bacterium]|nr:hypothetical protein [Nocardioidaceae bacterium]
MASANGASSVYAVFSYSEVRLPAGALAQPSSLPTVYDALTPSERHRLAAAGVVAEISGILVDDEGHPLQPPFVRRMLCPTADQLAQVPHVVALAYGAERAGAVAAALRTGLLHSVVVDKALAERLTEEAPPPLPQ